MKFSGPEEMIERPKRPLSAYNYFFKAERARLLGEEFDETKLETTVKRKHRKTPGMIGFRGLANKVGAKWKSLSHEGKKPFLDLFEKDRARYRREARIWTRQQMKALVRSSMREIDFQRMGITARPAPYCPDRSPSSLHFVPTSNSLIKQRTVTFNEALRLAAGQGKAPGLIGTNADPHASRKTPPAGPTPLVVEPIAIDCMTPKLGDLEKELFEVMNVENCNWCHGLDEPQQKRSHDVMHRITY
jgi:hypothetical protein